MHETRRICVFFFAELSLPRPRRADNLALSGPGAKAISQCLDPAAQTRLSALQVRFESDPGAQTRFISRNARNGEEMSALQERLVGTPGVKEECGD